MNAHQLIREARRRGIALEPAGDKLRWRGPRGAMTDDLKESLRRHKPEVLALLRAARPGHLFSYPLPGTLALGTEDPMDYTRDNEAGTWRYEPGWWRRIPERRRC